MFNQQTAQRTLDFLEEWQPAERYDHERKYQSELQEYLRQKLNQNRGPFGGSGEDHAVSTERGKSRGDVVVDDRIGIELKREFSNDQERKLKGQLQDYRKEYDFVIAVACGIEDMDGWTRVKKEFQNTGMGMGDPNAVPVEFVHIPLDRIGTGNQGQYSRTAGTSGTSSSASGGDVAGTEPAEDLLEKSIEDGIRGIRTLATDQETDMGPVEAGIAIVQFAVAAAIILILVFAFAQVFIGIL